MRANYYITALLVITSWSQPATAAEGGRVVLKNLRDGCRVYVDGQATSVNNGELTITTGKHEIQLEAPSVPSGWQASVQTVRIVPKQTLVVNVKWAPVIFPERGNRLFVAGAHGPEGVPGPAAIANRSPAALGNADAQRVLLLEGLNSSLSELVLLADFVEVTAESKRILGYYCEVKEPVSVEPGSAGEPGPQGEHGLPGQLFLIQDQNGNSLLELLKSRLGLDDMRKRLIAVSTELENRPSGYMEIRLLTPLWRTQYEAQYANKGPEESEHSEHPDIVGHHGPPGPRGVDGDVPRETPPVRLTAAQIAQLVILISTREFQAERRRIANRIETLERFVAETAGR